MKAAVLSFELVVAGRTRTEALDLLDTTMLATLNHIGGAPWVPLDDDVSRVQMPGAALADEYGFIYQAKKTMRFGGPILDQGETYHEGNKPQFAAENG